MSLRIESRFCEKRRAHVSLPRAISPCLPQSCCQAPRPSCRRGCLRSAQLLLRNSWPLQPVGLLLPSKAEPWGDRKAPDQQECCALLLSKQMLSLGINLASDNKVLMPLASEVDMVESRTKPLCLRSELQIFRSPSRAQHHTALLSSPRLTDESSQQPGTRF